MSNETTKNESQENNNKNKIQTEHLQNLDYFIQNCLNKFRFVDPLQSFYDCTGKDKDLIISHKSTIPDLVIWNKTFNKNECFEDANLNKESPFPRYRFYLRLNKDKDKKFNKDKEKKSKKNNKKKNKNKNLNNNEKNDNDNNNDNVNDNEANENKLVKEMNNLNINKEDDKKGNINPYNKNANVNNRQQRFPNKKKNNYIEPMNKFNINQNENDMGINKNKYDNPNYNNMNMNMNINNSLYQQVNNNNNNINLMHYNNNKLNQPNMNMNYNSQNNLNQGLVNNNNNLNKPNLTYNNNNEKFNNYQNQMMNKGEKKEELQAEFLFKLVYMYSLNKGWIVFTTQNQNQIVGYFNSFDLYKFLNEQLKNNNLNSFSVRTVNEPYMFSSENMFIILHKIIPLIIERNKNELFQKNP